MRSFDYASPASIEELLRLLDEHGADAKILAGGTDLMVRLGGGRMLPRIVIDLKRVASLRSDIVEIDSCLRIGARAVMADVIDDARIRRHFPALAEAAGVVGSVQIRNRATLAGNICNASPAADTAPALLVYDAVANLASLDGPRRVPLCAFFTGPGRTVLQRAEIVESIDLPLEAGAGGAAFGRLTRRRGVDLATVNLCCLVKPSGEVRFAYGAVGPRPFLVQDASGLLANPQASAEERDARLQELISAASPISDLRGGRDYRKAMLLVMSRRALETAHERLSAQGESGISATAGTCGAACQGPSREQPPGYRSLTVAAPFGATSVSEWSREMDVRHGRPRIPITLRVNGQAHSLDVAAHHTLLDVLRGPLGLTGSKECCAEGECGACTVLFNGRAVNACLVLAPEADGAEVTTIEGLAKEGRLDPLQSAFLEQGAVQCGFCIPGMIMTAKYLLAVNPHPDEAEIKSGLEGNLCRCGGYSRILAAVAAAAAAPGDANVADDMPESPDECRHE